VPPSLVLLGNLLVDDLVFPDGSTSMGQPGGAIMYGALGAALWGTRVGCVSLVGTDYPVTILVAGPAGPWRHTVPAGASQGTERGRERPGKSRPAQE
jgi:hypothetical protein